MSSYAGLYSINSPSHRYNIGPFPLSEGIDIFFMFFFKFFKKIEVESSFQFAFFVYKLNILHIMHIEFTSSVN